MSYGRWAPYVSVAKRRANAAKEMKKLKKKGIEIEPIEVQGRKIAGTFWGEAWCNHLEKFSDYKNRLPRGRTYVRNGSVCHLAISKGKVEAIVSGSSLYKIKINIAPLSARKWKAIRKQCAGRIGSMLELLQGRFSDNVMKIVTDQDRGLFPKPSEINLACDCPDWAEMCKHIAAVLYGVGARLDHQPELLFLLRNVDHEALISSELDIQTATAGKGKRRLVGADLSDVFGVDMEEPVKPSRKKGVAGRKAVTGKKAVKKKVAKKKAVKKAIAVKKKKKAFTPTAAAVARLRKRFKLNASQFATLVGVSPPTVSNWEHGVGRLNLRQRTRDALIQAAELTPEQALRRLNNLRLR
ncbi:MAG: helix-turn-helix domain-containing protein [Candidatus Thiodiazotropha sp. (ex Epidulcina cf. delphinae)]|nr:helix-turn-helix domain-containing protein [Candidatus Thiodiazotropha sp. (ex Epidulcina cf. delphinae)]